MSTRPTKFNTLTTTKLMVRLEGVKMTAKLQETRLSFFISICENARSKMSNRQAKFGGHREEKVMMTNGIMAIASLSHGMRLIRSTDLFSSCRKQ